MPKIITFSSYVGEGYALSSKYLNSQNFLPWTPVVAYLLEDRVYVQYDSAPVAVESLSFAVEEGVKVGAPAPLDIKIRKEFPESWIWEVVEDNGCGFI